MRRDGICGLAVSNDCCWQNREGNSRVCGVALLSLSRRRAFPEVLFPEETIAAPTDGPSGRSVECGAPGFGPRALLGRSGHLSGGSFHRFQKGGPNGAGLVLPGLAGLLSQNSRAGATGGMWPTGRVSPGGTTDLWLTWSAGVCGGFCEPQ